MIEIKSCHFSFPNSHMFVKSELFTTNRQTSLVQIGVKHGINYVESSWVDVMLERSFPNLYFRNPTRGYRFVNIVSCTMLCYAGLNK